MTLIMSHRTQHVSLIVEGSMHPLPIIARNQPLARRIKQMAVINGLGLWIVSLFAGMFDRSGLGARD